jgi:hypothetical protein
MEKESYSLFLECYNLTSTKVITPKHSERQAWITYDIGKILIIKMEGTMLSIISRTLRTAESTTESRNAISHTLHNVVEKQYLYQSKNRRRRFEPTPVSIFCPAYSISIKDSEGSKLVSAQASTVYAVWRIKLKTKQILLTVLPTQPNLA